MSKCLQNNEDSSIDGPEIIDDASSMNDLIEPKQNLGKRIFETINVKTNLPSVPEQLAASGASLTYSGAVNDLE
jgi:hypothetical protein